MRIIRFLGSDFVLGFVVTWHITKLLLPPPSPDRFDKI